LGDNLVDDDIDNDGYINNEDAFPSLPTEWKDYDNDGIGDNADSDDDNDGVVDVHDYAPRDKNVQLEPFWWWWIVIAFLLCLLIFMMILTRRRVDTGSFATGEKSLEEKDVTGDEMEKGGKLFPTPVEEKRDIEEHPIESEIESRLDDEMFEEPEALIPDEMSLEEGADMDFDEETLLAEAEQMGLDEETAPATILGVSLDHEEAVIEEEQIGDDGELEEGDMEEIECPACGGYFSIIVKERPIQISCPNCGVNGVLD
jgi:hypothetical protein